MCKAICPSFLKGGHKNVIQIQLGTEELHVWHGQELWVWVHCDLTLRDMILGQVHDTPLGHGQQLCEILSRSNIAVGSYDQNIDFWVPLCVHRS